MIYYFIIIQCRSGVDNPVICRKTLFYAGAMDKTGICEYADCDLKIGDEDYVVDASGFILRNPEGSQGNC